MWPTFNSFNKFVINIKQTISVFKGIMMCSKSYVFALSGIKHNSMFCGEFIANSKQWSRCGPNVVRLGRKTDWCDHQPLLEISIP
jgi:hypothetical protein